MRDHPEPKSNPGRPPRSTAGSASEAPLTPIRFLQRSAQVWSDSSATWFDGHSQTYSSLLDRVERLAATLVERGIQPGDRVATLLPNVPAMLELHFAVPAVEAVLVPLNTRLSASEYAYILQHSGVRLVFVSPELHDVVRDAVAQIGNRPAIIVTGDDSEYERSLLGARPSQLSVRDDKALFSINYTSGTTGRPKGVMYTHRGAYIHTLGVVADSRLDSTSRYLWTLPMFHCHGWAFPWAVTAMGATHYCLERLEPSRVWTLLREQRITHLCAAPTVVTMLVEAREAGALEQSVSVFVGGAPPSPRLLARAQAMGLHITHLYGLTETYGPLAICAWQPSWDRLPAEDQARLRARQGVGTIVTEPLRVVDKAGVDVHPDGKTLGEVVMRGNNVALGYYRDAASTKRAFRDGWFHSGDLAVMHEDGYIELRDRLKDIIISGGENISTIEVEHTLAQHPDVLEVGVVGVPDERWGEVVKAFVVVRPGSTLTTQELLEHARTKLARYKTPKTIVFIDSLPKTSTGKIQKFVLREMNPELTVERRPRTEPSLATERERK